MAMEKRNLWSASADANQVEAETILYLLSMSVYGLLLFASKLLMADKARLRTYIRPLRLAHVDAGP